MRTIVLGKIPFLLAALLAPSACKRASPVKPAALAQPGPRAIATRGPAEERLGWLVIREEGVPTDDLMTVAPADLPNHVRSLYRLRPDRRFLYALAELDRLATPAKSSGTLTLRHEGKRWVVAIDGEPAGDLPDFAGFEDAKRLLAARLRKMPKDVASAITPAITPEDAEALENGGPEAVLPALARIDRAWKSGARDAETLARFFRGLFWLKLQTLDTLQLSDVMVGKALAIFALAESRGASLAREEAVLARLMVYEDAAEAAAKRLPENDPIRLLCSQNPDGLRRIASQPGAAARTQYLWLLREAERGEDENVWRTAFEESKWGRGGDIPSLRLALAPAHFGRAETLSAALASRTDHLARGAGRSDGGDAESNLAAFEKAVELESDRLDGPLLDRWTVRAFYRSNFYSAIHVRARHYLDNLWSNESALAYAASLREPPEGTAAELRQWIEHRVALRRSPKGAQDVAADLSTLRNIGVRTLDRLRYTLATTDTSVTGVRRKPIRAYFDRLDSRPQDLILAAWAADSLDDIVLTEACARAAIVRAPFWASDQLCNVDASIAEPRILLAVAVDSRRPVSTRLAALNRVAKIDPSNGTAILPLYRTLIAAEKRTYSALFSAVDFLMKSRDFAEAQRLIDRWLEEHPDPQELQGYHVVTKKAELLRMAGKFERAWLTLQPALHSWIHDALDLGALLLMDLGKPDEALRMAEAAMDRYPTAHAAATLARIHWLRKEPVEAAKAITDSRTTISYWYWVNSIAPTFQEAHAGRPDAESETDFREIAKHPMPLEHLLSVVSRVEEKGNPLLAVKLCDSLKNLGHRPWVQWMTFHAIRTASGPDAGRQWILEHMTARDRNIAALQAFDRGEYSIVWDIPDQPEGDWNDKMYLNRAAALLHEHAAAGDPRRAKIIAYLESRPRQDPVVHGLYLMGAVDREAVLSRIKDKESVGNAGWVLGLRDASDGRFEEAASWLQVSMEAGSRGPELSAYAILNRWRETGVYLPEIARRKIF